MKKIVTGILIVLVGIICIANYSYASDKQLEATIHITPSTTEVVEGGNVTFTITTKNIVNAIENKICAIWGTIVYDTEVFEIDSTNTDIIVVNSGRFSSIQHVSEGETNGKITLKVKKGAKGNVEVKFTDLEAGDGRIENMDTLGKAITPDKSFKISIKQVAEEGDDGNNNQECNHTYQIKSNGTQHWKECTKCSKKDESTLSNHAFGNYVDNTDGTHSSTCSECKYKLTEQHSYKNGICNKCSSAEVKVNNSNNSNNANNANSSNNSNNTNGSNNMNNTNNTNSEKEIPKAGINSTLVVAILVLIIIAVLIYKKKEKYKDI